MNNIGLAAMLLARGTGGWRFRGSSHDAHFSRLRVRAPGPALPERVCSSLPHSAPKTGVPVALGDHARGPKLV